MHIVRRIILIIYFVLFGTNYLCGQAFKDNPVTITNLPANRVFKPFDPVLISVSENGSVAVQDGGGRIYYRSAVEKSLQFQAGGSLGAHTIFLFNEKGEMIATRVFSVDTRTHLDDSDHEFSRLLDMLFYTMNTGHTTAVHRYQGKSYTTFAGWFQDHIHVMKAMKYFYPDVTSGIDLFALGQREDGMIYDNYYNPYPTWIHWYKRFGPDFVKVPEDEQMNSSFFVRIPVENMSEFTFLEGVYYAWKASGNDAWMSEKLDHCLKAIQYATSDPYRWSKKYQLLKRGYTIDIWDFQPSQDIGVWGGDIMMAKPGVTNFGIMYGDNIGMYVGCQYVAEMLDHVGRGDEAAQIRLTGRQIKERIDALSWNGSFYTHQIPEDPSVVRDFGNTDVSKQVTISNAYAINRRIGQEKAAAIIRTYQNIAREMPDSSPGEWYLCYPPFEKGWHIDKWEYMNGGVSSIVAGEVAHGAFNHGFEDYGVYILRRMAELGKMTGNRLNCIYRGAMPAWPDRQFTPVSLASVANADICEKGAEGVPGWTGEGDNDLHEFPVGKQIFKKVPFEIVKPDDNNRKVCLILSGARGYVQQSSLPVNLKSKSIYFLQTMSGGNHVGKINLKYDDGTIHRIQVNRGENIAGWWYPEDGRYQNGRKPYYVAWKGQNNKSLSVGVYICGVDNPYPEKMLTSIDFESAGTGAKWMVLGVTLSDSPVFFMPEKYSFGAPDNWGAAAVTYALLEGLAGVKDTGVAFNKAQITPRWQAAGVDDVRVTLKYPASDGYCAYHYQLDAENRQIILDFTGSADSTSIGVLMKKNQQVQNVLLNNKKTDFIIKMISGSTYICLNISGVGVYKIKINYEE